MIALLHDEKAEFPADYLLARLRGRREQRRQRLAAQPAATAGPEEEALDREQRTELRWLYQQMNRKLREKLAPLFLFFELDQFIHWLRHAQTAKEGERLSDRFFQASLWPPTILRAWSRAGSARERLALLEQHLSARLPAATGVTKLYDRNQLAAIERQLTGAVLVHGASRSTSTPLREYFRARIDGANCVGVAKSWLWRLPAPPAALPAGNLAPAQLLRIWQTGEGRRLGLPATVHKENITPEQIAALAAEQEKTIRKTVRNQARLLDPLAAILDYLCFLETEICLRRPPF